MSTTAVRGNLLDLEHQWLTSDSPADDYLPIPSYLRLLKEQAQAQALIARRYSDPTSRLFPVTVTYFVPSQAKKISPLARSSSKCRQ